MNELTSFQALVNEFIDQNIKGQIVEKIFDETSKQQYFAIVVNRLLVFKIRLIFNLDNRFGENFYLEVLSDHLTLYSTRQKCNDIIRNLKENQIQYPMSNLQIYRPCDPKLKKFFFVKKNFTIEMMKNCSKDFQVGDHIKINSENLFFKNAIYIGNGKVIHVSDINDTVEESDLSQVLENKPFELISYVFYIKNKREIIEHAKRLLGTEFIENINNNFARLCVTGSMTGPNYTNYIGNHFVVTKKGQRQWEYSTPLIN